MVSKPSFRLFFPVLLRLLLQLLVCTHTHPEILSFSDKRTPAPSDTSDDIAVSFHFPFLFYINVPHFSTCLRISTHYLNILFLFLFLGHFISFPTENLEREQNDSPFSSVYLASPFLVDPTFTSRKTPRTGSIQVNNLKTDSDLLGFD